MNNRDINDAVPKLKEAWEHVQKNFADQHPDFPKFILAEVYRNPDLQRAYYAQGREKIAIVNSLRLKVQLAPISEQENRRKVTNAKVGTSKHNVHPSQAIDILFVKGKEILEDEKYYKAMAKFLREFDPAITWGADWNRNWKTTDEKFIDMPHFQV